MNGMNVFINNATNDLHCRHNSLLADFSHCDSVTLSTLFKTYCMNLYGSQMWRYNDKTTRFISHFTGRISNYLKRRLLCLS